MKKIHIIAAVFFIVAAIIAILSISDEIFSPYVSFAEAKKSGAFVQVIGDIEKSSPSRSENGVFSFKIRDADGVVMTIEHNGPRPVNFEHADKAVLRGAFNRQADHFIAEAILIKCPSKYQKKE